MSEEDKIVNITRIEKAVGRSYHTLKRWKDNTNFPMYKEGGQWVLSRKDWQDWETCQKNGEKYEKTEKKTRQSRKKTAK